MTFPIWVEVPVKDMERALAFYRAVFELPPIDIDNDGVRRTAILFYDESGKQPGVSLNQTQNFEPGDRGYYVYLNAGDDITASLKRVEAAGGKALTGKISMGQAGYYATVQDTEGNVFALYSTN